MPVDIDRLFNLAITDLNVPQRQSEEADMLRTLADDEPMIQMYYESGAAIGAVRKGITGPAASASSKQLVTTWNIEQWDVS